MAATNPRFKYNTSSVIGGRTFGDSLEQLEKPFIPIPHRILLDSRFSLAARAFATWCYGKSTDYVLVKKNLCFELGITEQQRRTIFAELKQLGVMAEVLTKADNLHYWELIINFTIFNGVENLEERKKAAAIELSTKNQNQQISPAPACDLLISTGHGTCVNQQITGAVEINQLNEQGVKKEKNKQQAAVVVQNSVTSEEGLEREIDQVMAEVGGEIKNRAAYRRGVKRNKLKAIAAAASIEVGEIANAKIQGDARSVCEQNLDRVGEVHGPGGIVCTVNRGDLGQFRNLNGGIFLVMDSARIWKKIHAGELDLRPLREV